MCCLLLNFYINYLFSNNFLAISLLKGLEITNFTIYHHKIIKIKKIMDRNQNIQSKNKVIKSQD